MRVELARSYEAEDKTGNAIKVWEDLCKLDPGNSFYLFELALSYNYRGWRNKSIERYEQIIAIDPGYVEAWIELIGCYSEAKNPDKVRQLVFESLDAIKEMRAGCVQLYTFAFLEHINDGARSAAEGCLQTIVDIVSSIKQYPHGECEMAMFAILTVVVEPDNADFICYLKQMVDLVPDLDDDIREAVEFTQFEIQLNKLEEEGYSVLFHDLLGTLLDMNSDDSDDSDDQDCLNDIMAMEANILMDLQGYRTQILRLKKDYPQLFALHSAFFNEALLTRDPDKLLYQRLKKLSRQGLVPELITADGVHLIDDDAEIDDYQVTTYRRDGPKTGRNDPCPCGSGKKYKKCCGA